MKKCFFILKNLVSMYNLYDMIIFSILFCTILRVFCLKVECLNIYIYGKYWKFYCVCSKYVVYIM